MPSTLFRPTRVIPTCSFRSLVYALALPCSLVVGCASASSPAQTPRTVRTPESSMELLAAGKRAMGHGDDVRAEHYLTLAMGDEHTSREALQLLMETCIRAARYSAALGHAKRYLHRHAEDVDLRYLVATLHDALGQPRLARQELTRVLTVEPSHGDAHYLAAHIFHQAGNEPIRARFHGERYLEVEPGGEHAPEITAMLEDLAERMHDDPPRAPERNF